MSGLSPLPATVVSGYLGAGKTSLVNHLLRNPQGRRLLIMVNDFGALNIDADLLVSADENTLTLSNGCMCCTMGAEMYGALDDALARRPAIDALVIEASGVAEPARIAQAAHAEPEMRYAGIVTVADAATVADRLADRLIGAQVAAQLISADLVLLTKTDLADEAAARRTIARHAAAPVLVAPHGAIDPALVLDLPDPASPGRAAGSQPPADHRALYRSWASTGGVADRAALRALLSDPPRGTLRLKGRVVLTDGSVAEAHLVGRTWSLVGTEPVPETRVVAIGLANEFDLSEMQDQWTKTLR